MARTLEYWDLTRLSGAVNAWIVIMGIVLAVFLVAAVDFVTALVNEVAARRDDDGNHADGKPLAHPASITRPLIVMEVLSWLAAAVVLLSFFVFIATSGYGNVALALAVLIATLALVSLALLSHQIRNILSK